MAGFHSFDLADLEKEQVGLGKAYREFLRRPAVSMGLYQLRAGGSDPQTPHGADEVYVVLRGRANLLVEREKQEVREGSIVSVDQGLDHSFVDITEDLSVLVVFAPPDAPDS